MYKNLTEYYFDREVHGSSQEYAIEEIKGLMDEGWRVYFLFSIGKEETWQDVIKRRYEDLHISCRKEDFKRFNLSRDALTVIVYFV